MPPSDGLEAKSARAVAKRAAPEGVPVPSDASADPVTALLSELGLNSIEELRDRLKGRAVVADGDDDDDSGREPRESADGEIPVREMIGQLLHSVGRPPKDERYSSSLATWVLRYLEEQRPILHLLALPPRWQVPVVTAVCGLGDFAQSNPGLIVKLRNRSDGVIRVQVGNRVIPAPPTPGSDGVMVEGAGVGRVKYVMRKLAPGQEIDLPAVWAIPAMRRHCGSIHPQAVRETSSSIPKTDLLEEVSYETRLLAPPGDEPSPRRR